MASEKIVTLYFAKLVSSKKEINKVFHEGIYCNLFAFSPPPLEDWLAFRKEYQRQLMLDKLVWKDGEYLHEFDNLARYYAREKNTWKTPDPELLKLFPIDSFVRVFQDDSEAWNYLQKSKDQMGALFVIEISNSQFKEMLHFQAFAEKKDVLFVGRVENEFIRSCRYGTRENPSILKTSYKKLQLDKNKKGFVYSSQGGYFQIKFQENVEKSNEWAITVQGITQDQQIEGEHAMRYVVRNLYETKVIENLMAKVYPIRGQEVTHGFTFKHDEFLLIHSMEKILSKYPEKKKPSNHAQDVILIPSCTP